MSVRQGSQSYSDATCDSNSSADAMNVVSGPGGRSCFWAPGEMHNRDLVLALSDDIVVRQRLGNHAPSPARQSMPRSDFSPQFRSPATTSMGTAPNLGGAAISARSFGGRSDQVAAARNFVRQALGSLPVLDEAVLLTSELCANALQHTRSGSGGTFTVTVVREADRARIEVRDGGASQVPAANASDAASERGRGLGLVEALADRWGRGGQSGRTVFFALTWVRGAPR